MSRDAGKCLLSLLARFEEEFADFAGTQALDEIEKGAVLRSTLAAAIGFAAREKLLNE